MCRDCFIGLALLFATSCAAQFPRQTITPAPPAVIRRVVITGFPLQLPQPFPVRTAGPGRTVLDLGVGLVRGGDRWVLQSGLPPAQIPAPPSAIATVPHRDAILTLERHQDGWRLMARSANGAREVVRIPRGEVEGSGVFIITSGSLGEGVLASYPVAWYHARGRDILLDDVEGKVLPNILAGQDAEGRPIVVVARPDRGGMLELIAWNDGWASAPIERQVEPLPAVTCPKNGDPPWRCFDRRVTQQPLAAGYHQGAATALYLEILYEGPVRCQLDPHPCPPGEPCDRLECEAPRERHRQLRLARGDGTRTRSWSLADVLPVPEGQPIAGAGFFAGDEIDLVLQRAGAIEWIRLGIGTKRRVLRPEIVEWRSTEAPPEPAHPELRNILEPECYSLPHCRFAAPGEPCSTGYPTKRCPGRDSPP